MPYTVCTMSRQKRAGAGTHEDQRQSTQHAKLAGWLANVITVLAEVLLTKVFSEPANSRVSYATPPSALKVLLLDDSA